ncbi:MAG: hypothetical protein ACI4VH_02625 [Clostridia bacterium]
MLKKVIEQEHNEKNRIILKRIIFFILEEKLKTEDRELLLKKLEREGESMVLEVIRKENENLIRRGKKEGKLEILKQSVKNMLQFGENEEKIMKYVGINKKELEKIKRML